MPFQYDPAKSAANKAKHGIDFEEAQEWWGDDKALIRRVTTHSEVRFLFIGRIGQQFWTAVTTDRDGNTRIISVRRARDNEIEDYLSRGI